MNILVLGASGLLGNAVFRILTQDKDLDVYGTLRKVKNKDLFIPELAKNLLLVEDLANKENLLELFKQVQPNVVINCSSLNKTQFNDSLKMLTMYSLLPKQLAHLCYCNEARLIQISSDGVFQGVRGNYTENDLPDAADTYGIVKYLGEIDAPHVITLRTSIIGHELNSKNGLLEWFLAQEKECIGHTQAIYSGLPAVVLAKVIRDVVLPMPKLQGVYHIATQPISKFKLLQIIAEKYNKQIHIIPDDRLVKDLSLSAEKFTKATGYTPANWHQLIDEMAAFKFGLKES